MSGFIHSTYAYLYTYKIVAAIIIYETVAIILYEQFKTDIRIPCIWRSLSGLKCFGCGLSTAFGSLTRLRFTEAYQNNALIYPVILIACGFFMKHFIEFSNQYQILESNSDCRKAEPRVGNKL